MKIITIAALVTLPFLFGCTSTAIKTYSADFKVSPVETKDVGETITTPEGDTYTILQVYRFECILKETTQPDKGEAVTRIVSSPVVTTAIGHSGRVGVIEEGTAAGSTFEVKSDESESEYHAYLKATIKRAGSKPVSCSQTITIKK